MKQSDTPASKEPKKIRLKDLIAVDYTDDSWPEDEEGQLAYDYWKRASGVLDEEEIEEGIDWFKLVYGDSKLAIAKKIKATPSKTLETLAKSNPNAAGAQKFQHEFAVKELEYRKKINDHSDGNPKYKKEYGNGYSHLEDSLEESHDSQISKYELNGELKRVNDRIKFLRAAHHGSSLPKDVSSELKRLEDQRDSILSMLKEEDILEDVDSETITEALNMLQRMKRRAIMRRNKSKILAGRRRAQRRRASTSVLQQRAVRAARAALARRLLHKNKGEASYGEKVRVERMLAARQGAIKNIARRLLSKVRQKERMRFQKHATPPKPIQSIKPNK